MSEGINFSDDLARCVAVVGLPFGNTADAELRERMAYLDRRAAVVNGGDTSSVNNDSSVSPPSASSLSSSTSNMSSPPTAGRDYYENLCMRAVNQSIGRSIRHAGDHAIILLFDARYTTPRIRGKLPRWIGDRVSAHETWGSVAAGIGGFFTPRRAKVG